MWETGPLREAMLRGGTCVGPGSGYRAISKVQEASSEKGWPRSLQGASCPHLRMTWMCHSVMGAQWRERWCLAGNQRKSCRSGV